MCGSQVLFDSLGRLEHLDVAALVAPRPMLVESGISDPIFPHEAASETVAQLRLLYDYLAQESALPTTCSAAATSGAAILFVSVPHPTTTSDSISRRLGDGWPTALVGRRWRR